MLQVILGLGLVLAAIAGCAWLLRRFGRLQANGAGAIKVIGGSQVGQRERVVLIEVGAETMLLGIGAGGVTLLSRWDAAGASVDVAPPAARASTVTPPGPTW